MKLSISKNIIPEKVFSYNPYISLGLLLVFALIMIGIFGLQVAYAGKILPNVKIGEITVGGLTKSKAQAKVTRYLETHSDLRVVLNDKSEIIELENIDYQVDISATINEAWAVGRESLLHQRVLKKMILPFRETKIIPVISYNASSLDQEIDTLTQLWELPRRDIRFSINATEVKVLTDTAPGFILNTEMLRQQIDHALLSFSFHPIETSLVSDKVRVDPATVPNAILLAEKIMSSGLTLTYKYNTYKIEPEVIGTWILSGYEGNALVPILDKQKISAYVAELATSINTAAQNVSLLVKDGKVVDFIPPRSGRVLAEDETVVLISNSLVSRLKDSEIDQEISLPVADKRPLIDEDASGLGITELIGKATTPFTGSPPNRISNIKNGTKFLSGTLISPDEEFSTVQTLGTIDNTTGYLPELVIKGNRTVPEFGGGLCQVSTTLFRSVLNAGLPVTARRNHSYRVSYYEKDAEGNFIGPGLDATIYDPNPDFRFKNDTGHNILITGYVEGDLITFELYGTSDGRTAIVDGPYTLGTVPAGDPIFIETDELEPGQEKRIETAHPGGTAVATYKVTYPDGKIIEQVFNSSYRPWPAQYLVGIEASKQTEETASSSDVVVEDESN